MFLTEFFERFMLEGLSFQELEEILACRSEEKYATDLSPDGILIRSHSDSKKRKLIGCVTKYFTTDVTGKPISGIPTSASYHRCDQVRRRMGLTNCSNCMGCLQAAISKMANGSFHRTASANCHSKKDDASHPA